MLLPYIQESQGALGLDQRGNANGPGRARRMREPSLPRPCLRRRLGRSLGRRLRPLPLPRLCIDAGSLLAGPLWISAADWGATLTNQGHCGSPPRLRGRDAATTPAGGFGAPVVREPKSGDPGEHCTPSCLRPKRRNPDDWADRGLFSVLENACGFWAIHQPVHETGMLRVAAVYSCMGQRLVGAQAAEWPAAAGEGGSEGV